MEVEFYKYQGTGNDFIMIDDRAEGFDINRQPLIEMLCHRRFGIGADGLILLRNHAAYDFEMIYFNSDGRQSSMCGNGGRCIIAFAKFLHVIEEHCTFLAIDGPHDGNISNGLVSLKMNAVNTIEKVESNQFFLDTGSPHVVKFIDQEPTSIDILPAAHAIRYNARFKQEGTNVNFTKVHSSILDVRTYERGVEEETYSCGTGVTAVALAAHFSKQITEQVIQIKTKGGNLEVDFEANDGRYQNIWLKGPAQRVFKGAINIDDLK